jgi:hypothetical protein
MLSFPGSVRVCLCREPVDLRKSFDGLMVLVGPLGIRMLAAGHGRALDSFPVIAAGQPNVTRHPFPPASPGLRGELALRENFLENFFRIWPKRASEIFADGYN